jgi:hypothetical protein
MADRITEIVREAEQLRAKDLSTLLKLWNDPRFADVVALLRNGHVQQSEPVKMRVRRNVASGSHANSGLRDAIRALRDRLPTFTPDDVLKALEESGFDSMGPRNPKDAIRDTLRRLCERKEIRKKKRGKGGAQNVYEWRTDEQTA